MAKKPDPDKTPRPDDGQPNPAAEDQAAEDAALAELLAEADPDGGQPSESAVNLGQPGGPAPSQASPGGDSFDWADLVNEPAPSTGGSGQPAQFDSPSDADVLRAARPPAARDEDDESVIPSNVRGSDVESSRVDLSEPPPLDDPLASRAYEPAAAREPGPETGMPLVPDEPLTHEPAVRETMQARPGEPPDRLTETMHGRPGDPDDPLAVTMRARPGEPPARLGETMLAADARAGDDDSAVDLGSHVEIVTTGSSIELGGEAVAVSIDSGTGLPRSGIEILPEANSASDLFVGADSAPGERAGGGGQSGVDLGAAGRPDGPVSAIFVGAAGSGIDLGTPLGAGDEASGTGGSGIDVTAGVAGAASGVDLHPRGGRADEGGSSVNLGSDVGDGSGRDFIAEAVESGVDLGRRPGGPPESGSYADIVIADEPAADAGSAVDLGGGVTIEGEDEPAAAAFPAAGHAETVTWDAEVARGAAGDGSSGHVHHGGVGAETDDSDEGTLADRDGAPSSADDDLFVGGDAVAVDDEEETFDEPAAVADDDEPAPKPVRPNYGRRWAGGMLVGGLLGGAACVGLWAFGVEPPKQLREMVGGAEAKQGPAVPPPKAAPARPADLLAAADWAKDAPEVDPANKDELVARGRFRWLQHLNRTKQPKLEDDGVQRALEDFQQAATAEAFYWQGHVYETLGNAPKAREFYAAGLKDFAADADAREMFEAAIQRLELRTTARATPPVGAAPSAWNAVLLLTLVQPPMGDPVPPGDPMPPPAPPKLPEAGFAFWKAARLARAHKFPQAQEALKQARQRHVDRRMDRLMKAQNPISDPTEDVFVRVADELAAYWALQQKLAADGYLNLADKADPVKAAETALADLKGAKKTLTEAQAELTTAKKNLTDLQTEHTRLTEAKTKADEAVTKLTTDLTKARKDTTDAQAALTEARTKLGDATKKADGLTADNKDLEATVRAVGEKVGLKDLDPKADKPMLLRKVDAVVALSGEKDPGGRLMKLTGENQQLAATLAERWTPDAMLGYWQAALADRGQKELAAAAVKDADRARADAKATADTKARAQFVAGLAARNQGDAARARTALADAVKDPAAGKGTWRPAAEQALKELTDPTAYHAPRAAALQSQQKYAEAVAALDDGLKAFPDNGKLLALRSRVRLDAALDRAGGKLKPGTPGVAEAVADAEAAVKAGEVAVGHYAAGRVAEELGDLRPAAAHYRKAVAATRGDGPEAIEYRLALARVLLQATEPKVDTSRLPSPRDLLVLAVVAVQPPSDAEGREAALKDLEEILKRPNVDPLQKARAMALQGRWTEALNTYVGGLKPHLSREQHAGLAAILEAHPMQRAPDRLRVPHPFQAERFFTAGLGQFHSGDYAGAEDSFGKAIGNYDQDARYFYYLGLARLRQQKRGAVEDFATAARLEFDGRPARDAVDAALERIQGEARRLIDRAREKVR